MSKQFTLRLGNTDGELTHVQLDNNQSILLESASLAYRSASISGSTLNLFSLPSTGSITPITHSYEIVSSSYAVTASYAMSSSVEITLEHSSSYAQSASYSDNSNTALTASYFADGIVTASAANNILTFTKDDNSTFAVTINTGSQSADYIYSASFGGTSLFLNGSGSAIDDSVDISSVVSPARVVVGLRDSVSIISASQSAIKTNIGAGTNNSIISGSKTDADTLRLHTENGNNFDYIVGGGTDDRVDGLLLESGAVKTRLNTIEAATSSYALIADISGSGNVRFEALNAATSSYALKTDISGSGNIRFEALNIETGSLKTRLSNAEATGSSVPGLLAITGSFIKDAALSGSTTNTIRFTQQDDNTIDITIATSSVSIDGLLSSSAQIAGDISGSGNVRFEALNAATSSYLLNTTDTLTGNLTVTGIVTATSASFERLDTQIISSSVIYNSGSNIFGDSITDKHIFSGSVHISGGLDLGGGDARGNDITGAFWEGYVISASKVDIDVSGYVDTTGTPEDNDFAKFTDSNTVEGRSYSEVRSDLGLVIGTNVLAEQTIGIADDNLLEVDDTDAEDNDYAKFTANGLEGRSYSEVRSDLGLTKGISDGNILAANDAVSDDDFLRINGTEVEGLTAAEVKTALGVDIRTVGVDTNGNGAVNNTLETSEDLVLKKGSNVSLSEAGGVVTIAASNTNQLTTFQVEDGDGTEVTISHGKEWKFAEGTGIDINWTDIDNGTDGDPYDLTITNTAPMTGDEFDADGTFASLRAQGTTKGDVGLGDVENTALSTYTGNGGALDNQYITNGAGYTTAAGTVDTTGTVNADEFPQFHDSNTLKALTAAQMRTALNVENGADVTDTTNVKSNLPAGVPSGSASAARSQIGAGTGTVDTSGSPVDNDYAKFTDANTVEGRSYSQVRSDLGLGTIYSKDYTATVANGSGDIPDGDAVYDHVTSRLSGYVNKSGTPAAQQIAIFTDTDTISGSTNFQMHVNSGYPQFNGVQIGDGGTSNLYLGNAITPSSADKGARFHSNDNDFYFDFQGDATQNWYLRDYDGSGGTHTRFTFDFINSNFAAATATFSGNVTANNFVTTSDRELKDNIVPIKEGLETLKKFVSYEYELEGRKDAGFIAQEVEESLSYAVHKKQDGYLALDTKPILAHMHKAILEIDQRLSAIEDKLK